MNTIKKIFALSTFLLSIFMLSNVNATELAPYHIEPTESYENSIGGSDMVIDMDKMDANFPQMNHWIKAGVEGGIPSLKSDLKRTKVKFTPKTFNEADVNAKIKELSENGGGIIYLKNGNYSITSSIDFCSNVTLIGESQDKVIITIDSTFTAPEFEKSTMVMRMGEVENCGIRNLTIKGGWLNEDGKNYPKHPWNDKAIDELPGVKAVSIYMTAECENCYIDQVSIINCALHPIMAKGTYCTIRNCYVDGAFRKGGGCQGYLFLGGSYNLMTGCFVTHLRHISLQTPRSFYNVVYDNLLYQEVSFHTNDGGNNLIENNRIFIPEDMPTKYYAIMGPWATFHKISAVPNFIYKNTCIEKNHDDATPWSDPNILYDGPYFVRPKDPNTNFGPREGALPKGGTLYPVVVK